MVPQFCFGNFGFSLVLWDRALLNFTCRYICWIFVEARLLRPAKLLYSKAMQGTALAAKTLPLFSSHSAFLENFNGSVLSFPNTFSIALSKHEKRSLCLKASLQSTLAPELNIDLPSALDRVKILSEALPFIQKFRGKTMVVKYGGAAMKSEALQASVITDIVLLSCVGIRIVFVHGGGPEINHWLGKLNIQPNFLNGLRVTDSSTMEIVSMVLVGKVNKNLVALINKAGGTAVGLSGIDGRIIRARPSPNSAQLGFVGEIVAVDPTLLRPLINHNHIPVIATVAADETGQSYNINADTAAGEIAAALGAEKLLLLTDVPGILKDRNDPGSLLKDVNIKEVKKMVEKGEIAGGMIPKVDCCLRSLARGVRTTSIIEAIKTFSTTRDPH